MTLSTMMAVLSKVKDLANFSKKIRMPDNLSKEIFSSQATEIVGKVSSFCLETKPSWNLLEEILIKCKEMEAADTTQLLQQYNHEGRHPGTRLVLPMIIQQHHVTQLHVHMIKQYLTLSSHWPLSVSEMLNVLHLSGFSIHGLVVWWLI